MALFKSFTRWLLGGLFIAAGVNHFWHTDFYMAMMPPYLPWHLPLVWLSGLAEIGLGALLLLRRWQIVAAWGLIALCIAVFPANVYMAMNPGLFPQFTPQGLTWRLPLQAVAMLWAWWYTRTPKRR